MAFLDDLIRNAQNTATRIFAQPQPQKKPAPNPAQVRGPIAMAAPQGPVLQGPVSRVPVAPQSRPPQQLQMSAPSMAYRMPGPIQRPPAIDLAAFGRTLGSGIQQSAGNLADMDLMARAVLNTAVLNANPFVDQASKDRQTQYVLGETEKLRKKIKDTKTITGESFNPYQDFTPSGNLGQDIAAVGGRSLQTGLDGTMLINPARAGLAGLTGKQAAVQVAKTAGKEALLYGGTAGTAAGATTYGQTGDIQQAIDTGLKTGLMAGTTQAGLNIGGYAAGRGVRAGVDQAKAAKALHDSMTPAQRQAGFIAGPGAKGFKDAQAKGMVFDGVDGKQRFEVDDSGAKLITDRPKAKPTKLPQDIIDQKHAARAEMMAAADRGDMDAMLAANARVKELDAQHPENFISNKTYAKDILDHPTLFEQYPELRTVEVDIKPLKGKNGMAIEENGKTRIVLDSTTVKNDPNYAKGTLLHELQHVVQNKEKFAGGSSDPNYDLYRRSAGEAEARAVQARMNMGMGERYKPADLTQYQKRYHQTSAEAAKAINNEGFKLDNRTSGANDILPVGVNTKKTTKDLGLGDADSQLEVYFNKDANIKEFLTRDEAERFFMSHPEGTKFREAVLKSKQIDQQYQALVDEVGQRLDARYREIWEKGIKTKDDPAYQKIRAEEERIIEEWGKKVDEQAQIAQKESTRISKLEGWDGIHMDQDVGSFGRVTDNTIILDPSKVNTESRLPKRSTFYDSLDVPKDELIVREGGGKAMSIVKGVNPEDIVDKSFKNIAKDGKVVDLDLKAISSKPNAVDPAEVTRLASSKNTSALVVKSNGDGTFTIVDGFHRFDAASQGGIKSMRAVVINLEKHAEVVRKVDSSLLPNETHEQAARRLGLEKEFNTSAKAITTYGWPAKEQNVAMSIDMPRSGKKATEDFYWKDLKKLEKKYGKVHSDPDRNIARLADEHFDELDPQTQRYLEFEARGTDFESRSTPEYKGFANADANSSGASVHGSQIHQLRQVVEDGNTAKATPKPTTKASKFANGKITANQLENIRQREASTAKPSTKKALPQARIQEPSIKGFRKTPKASGSTSTVKLNTNRLDIPEKAKVRLDKETNEVIKKLSNEEVKQFAKAAGMDMKSYSEKATRKKIAEQLNLRNEIATVEENIAKAKKNGASPDEIAKMMEHSAELGRTSRTQGTDLGRQLQARRIIADQLATPQQRLFRLFDEAGIDSEVYTKRLATVDMNNADEVMKAYRDLIPAKFSDWLDKYRYTNMLSSPLTHIVNITSNIGGLAGVAPVEKLFAGAVDAARSKITGGPRTRYAGEAGAYLKGVKDSVPEAMKKFSDVMTGKQLMEMPDADALKNGRLATEGVAGVADKVLSFVPKLLEASDQFGMTLARGGELAGFKKRASRGIELPKDLTGAVDDAALYRVFRQELGKQGQGHLLGAVDAIPQAILTLRRSKNPAVSTIAKYTIPFVTTPVNLFKQGLEYSPAGFLTLAGHADKTGQAAKAVMGTTVVGLAAASLAQKGDITFAEPSDSKQRDAFRAEGKQPYAIKIGGKWVGYSKMHPAIAFNLAAVAAAKEALDKGATDEAGMNKILGVMGGVMGYYRDQSFMKGVGDFTSSLEMKDGADAQAAIVGTASNWSKQLVPFNSMVSWIGRQVDPTQRKTDYKADPLTQYYQNMTKDMPGLNKNTPVRENPYYKDQSIPIMNDNPTLNSFSPLRITNDKGYGNTTGLNITERRKMYELPDAEKPAFRQAAIDEKFKKKQEKIAQANNGTKSTDTSGVKTASVKKQTEAISDKISKDDKSTLNNYYKMDANKRKEWFNKNNDAEFKYEKARYENQKANGEISDIQDVGRRKTLAKAEIGSKFSKETRDLYQLGKADIYDYITKAKNGDKLAKELVDYDNALQNAGLTTYGTAKFKNGLAPQKGGKKASGKAKGRKSSGGRVRTAKGVKEQSGNKSAIAASSKGYQAAAKAKLAKKKLSVSGGVRKPGIQAYKKPTKTTVAMRRA